MKDFSRGLTVENDVWAIVEPPLCFGDSALWCRRRAPTGRKREPAGEEDRRGGLGSGAGADGRV